METETKNEEKNAIRDKVAEVAGTGAQHAAKAAKGATGWLKWLYIALAVIAAGVAALLETGCTLHMTKLPDGTTSFSSSIAQPVIVQEGK